MKNIFFCLMMEKRNQFAIICNSRVVVLKAGSVSIVNNRFIVLQSMRVMDPKDVIYVTTVFFV